MNLETTFLIFVIVSLSIGLTIYIIFNTLGPAAENLLDPFEEDED